MKTRVGNFTLDNYFSVPSISQSREGIPLSHHLLPPVSMEAAHGRQQDGTNDHMYITETTFLLLRDMYYIFLPVSNLLGSSELEWTLINMVNSLENA